MKHVWTIMWSALAIAFIVALIFGSIYENEYHHTGSIGVDKVHSCVAYSYSANYYNDWKT